MKTSRIMAVAVLIEALRYTWRCRRGNQATISSRSSQCPRR